MTGKIRVVLVGPEHDMNVGACARAMKNFGCTELALVNPVAKLGFEAKKFAKHSTEVIDFSVSCKSLQEAVKGFDLVVATSGVVDRFGDRLKNTVQLPGLPELIEPGTKVAIVFGRESTGLSKEELDSCDLVCVIPASKEHTVLNLSHAVAVVLYELYRVGTKKSPDRVEVHRKPASRANRQLIQRMFGQIVHSLPSVHDPEKVSAAMRNVIERSRASDDEVRSIVAGLSPVHASRKAAAKKK